MCGNFCICSAMFHISYFYSVMCEYFMLKLWKPWKQHNFSALIFSHIATVFSLTFWAKCTSGIVG